MEVPLDAFDASAPAPARVAAHDEPRVAKRAVAAVPHMSASPPRFPPRGIARSAPAVALSARPSRSA